MKKTKKPKRRYTRLIDLILNIILLGISVFTIYKVIQLQMLPAKWLMAVCAILAIIFLLFFFLMFKNMGKVGIFIKRVFLIALCILISFAGYSIGNVTSAVNKVSIPDSDATVKISLLVPKDSDIDSVKDIAGANIGIQVGTDEQNSEYGQQQLSKAVSGTITYSQELDYSALGNLLLLRMVDGMLISDTYLGMLDATLDGFKDSYKVITTYERQQDVNPSDAKDITKESFTLLISGVDEVGAADQSHLSDVNILLFVNPVANQITMVSLPRDSLMPHYAKNWMNDKLTHTGNYGIEDTVNTVENFFNIDIDYYAKVSFTSLIEIVDSIGGIDVDVEIAFEEQDENRSFAYEDMIRLQAGMQHLNGKQALAYARHRHTDNYDVAGRQRAQERIIKAIIDRLLSVEGITTYVNRLMETVPKYVVTNMPGNQITAFIRGELQNLSPWSIQSLAIENGIDDNRADTGASYLWDQYDYRLVVDAYNQSKKTMQFDDFNFDLGELDKYLPQIKHVTAIVWNTQAVNPY